MDARLERDRYVTAHYEDLQGLLWVPFGALLVVAGVFAGLVPGTGSRLAGDLLALGGGVLVLGAVLSWVLIRSFYQGRYGRALETESASSRRYGIYLSVALPLLAAVLFIEFMFLGGPGSPLGFVAAVAAGGAASWWPDRRFRRHWLVGAALISACCALRFVYELATGAAEATEVLPGMGYYGPLLALVGIYLLVCGVQDHRLLAGTVKESPEVAGENG